MAKEKIEQRFGKGISCLFDSFKGHKHKVFDFDDIFRQLKEEVTGNNFNAFFSLNSLTLAYELPSLKKSEIPDIPSSASRTERRAAELEYQATHTYEDSYAAKMLFSIRFGHRTPEILFSSASLKNIGNKAYLPLIVPYLSDSSPIQIDQNFSLHCSIEMIPEETPADHAEIIGYCTGFLSYDFDTGLQRNLQTF